MDYSEGIKKILNLSPTPGNFSPYSGITITYPGKKGLKDYVLNVEGGQRPTYSNLSKNLYDLVTNNNYKFEELKSLLSDIYSNGTNTEYNDLGLKYLQNLIYWTTLQEEINYPRKNGFSGINLPFCRLFEAIYSTKKESQFSIIEVQNRCNNYGQPKPTLYNIAYSPDFYHY